MSSDIRRLRSRAVPILGLALDVVIGALASVIARQRPPKEAFRQQLLLMLLRGKGRAVHQRSGASLFVLL